MSMTASYLKATQTPVIPQPGKSYRVIGFCVPGAIYQVEKIEEGLCYFKGYVRPQELTKCKFFKFSPK